MEISLKSIEEVEDPYHAFVDSIKNSETLRKYNNHLHDFLKLVPTSVYLDFDKNDTKFMIILYLVLFLDT